MGATLGTDVDFFETSRVNRVDYNASLDLRPSSRLRVSATYVSSTLTRRLDDRRTTFTKIPRVKFEYQIARPIFVRVVSQYTANLREPLRDPRTGEILLVGAPGSLTPAGAKRVELAADGLAVLVPADAGYRVLPRLRRKSERERSAGVS